MNSSQNNQSNNNQQNNIEKTNIIEKIQESFFSHIAQTLSLDPSTIHHTPLTLNLDSGKEEFGDLSSTIALTLAKQLKRSPVSIAQQIASSYVSEYIIKIEVAGPGFLNLFFSPKTISELGQELYTQNENFFKPSNLTAKSISIEF